MRSHATLDKHAGKKIRVALLIIMYNNNNKDNNVPMVLNALIDAKVAHYYIQMSLA